MRVVRVEHEEIARLYFQTEHAQYKIEGGRIVIQTAFEADFVFCRYPVQDPRCSVYNYVDGRRCLPCKCLKHTTSCFRCRLHRLKWYLLDSLRPEPIQVSLATRL